MGQGQVTMGEWSLVLQRSAWKAMSFDIFINNHNKKKKKIKERVQVTDEIC